MSVPTLPTRSHAIVAGLGRKPSATHRLGVSDLILEQIVLRVVSSGRRRRLPVVARVSAIVRQGCIIDPLNLGYDSLVEVTRPLSNR